MYMGFHMNEHPETYPKVIGHRTTRMYLTKSSYPTSDNSDVINKSSYPTSDNSENNMLSSYPIKLTLEF